MYSHIISYMPTNVVKDILNQIDPDGKRGKWKSVLPEYDLEIKPTKFIKGHGLAKLMAQSNCDSLNLHMISELLVEEKNP